ncbi:amino acid ABC transporter substrate-binding protein (PAAT family) [Vreelandella songnenensis]|uniref:Amino acid ABC transporter substrate-binding protein (PAAT family) n=1 Tax=Vreelandella songnenensis TaxID=1176243 RepID=A0A2T0V544_9GAMM|nr:ABC transporter substrate-binding protein [Halomonas songnenensis]PRY65296.1 amino acid ABC transporter substrate-binding protein (PAAT family) [Halomonas songnenensis]
MSEASRLRKIMAPTGVLRTTINVGNPILAGLDAEQQPFGVSVDLAKRIAQRLEVELELQVYASAGEAVDIVSSEKADMGFFALDPKRGESIEFTAPYVLIEGCYLVREDSPITDQEDVDRPGQRIVVGKGSAYDLYLSRTIQHAELVRAPTSPKVVEFFREHQLDIAAGVKQQLEAGIEEFGGLRLLPGHFMTIQQAMGVPRNRPPEAAAFLSALIEEVKAEGEVARLLEKHAIQGASVAPAA